MYPEKLSNNEPVDASKAVLLVNVSGPGRVTYLQFVHSSMPAINVKFDASPQGNAIVALAVPVGLKNVSLKVYTVAGRGAGYTPFGSSFGYIEVSSPRMDLARPGLYFVATIFPASPNRHEFKPPGNLRSRLQAEYPNLAGLKAMNF